jgi:lauroyl/myristoyl acyltransferase
MASVAAPLANRPLDTLFNRIRSDTGQRVVSKRGAIRALLKILRDNRKVALLLDQNTKPSESGLFVEFFGKPAPVSTAAAALALRSRTPILFGYCIPDQQGHYTISRMQQMLPPEAYDQEDRQACTRRLTRDIACSMENKIREYPEHWLWMYKRWKYIAPGYTREDYPFYAKELTPHDRKIAEATLQAARPTT